MLSEHHFSCAYWPSVYILQRNVYLGLLPIFWLACLVFLILSSMSCLCILEINLLSVASFANIFSYSEDYIFVLFMISFAMLKLSNLIESHLFIFEWSKSEREKQILYIMPICRIWKIGIEDFIYKAEKETRT